jgi:cell division protein ZapA
MNKQTDAIKIQIMDKEYLVTCPDEERDELIASAEHLSTKMSEIRSSGKVVGIDRIAVMAGLNLAHEAIRSGYLDTEHTQSTANRLEKLNARIEETLAKHGKKVLN